MNKRLAIWEEFIERKQASDKRYIKSIKRVELVIKDYICRYGITEKNHKKETQEAGKLILLFEYTGFTMQGL